MKEEELTKKELILYLSGKITLNMHKYLIHFTVNDIDVDSQQMLDVVATEFDECGGEFVDEDDNDVLMLI